MTDVTATDAAVPLAERRAEVLDPSVPLEARRRVIAELETGDPLLRELAYTALPEALVDALIAHPSARVRGTRPSGST